MAKEQPIQQTGAGVDVPQRRRNRPQHKTLSKSLTALGVDAESGGELASTLNLALFVFLLVFINAVLFYAHQTVKEQVFINGHVSLIDELKLLSQQMPGLALQASIGQSEAFGELGDRANAFSLALLSLKGGREEPDMPAALRALDPQFAEVEAAWRQMNGNATVVIDSAEEILSIRDSADNFYLATPELQALMDEVLGLMVQGKEPAQKVYFASLQLVYAERMASQLERALHGEVGSAIAANEFARWAVAFRDNLDNMRGSGSTEAAAQVSVRDPTSLALLEEVDTVFSAHEVNVPVVLDGISRFFQIREAASRITDDSQTVLQRLDALAAGYRGQTNPGIIADEKLVYTAAGVVTLLLVVLFMPMLMGLRRRIAGAAQLQREAMLQSQSQNMAVLQLLDEIEPLQDGDLTVEASVDEAFTGTIADAINSSIETLRRLVSTINETSTQLSGTAQKTAQTTNALAAASEQQAKDIGSATQSITMMAQSMESVSAEAKRSAEVAKNSVDLARRGGEAVRVTIQGMEDIRQQIQETSKRIKRLGESSQEIGEIVGLIDDIADQTNILALNAAIQASSAGEAGRGFAVVADEVQRLAERSARATKQIETIVATIQNDTNDAVISMEETTTQVVSGAQRAEGAGAALDEIENVSSELAQLIDNISRTTSKHAEGTVGISRSMTLIEDVTRRTSAGTGETAASIGELAGVAENLKEQVSGFRLPGLAAED